MDIPSEVHWNDMKAANGEVICNLFASFFKIIYNHDIVLSDSVKAQMVYQISFSEAAHIFNKSLEPGIFHQFGEIAI